ncbi:MAG: pyridoxamine 5'-phosphate oxidase family protein [Ilumatobacteraceae bacterium]
MEIVGRIESVEQLEALYRRPTGLAVDKQLDRLTQGMIEFVGRSTLLMLGTTDGSGSLDVSPRGGPAGFIRVLDDRHLAVPDLNGNNRLDSFRNLVRHPWAGLLVLNPGNDETLRVNGPAVLSNDPDLLAGFTSELRTPKLAVVVEVAEVYGHCAKAFQRSGTWDPATWRDETDRCDLASMYLEQWRIEPDAMRATLAETYAADLARD